METEVLNIADVVLPNAAYTEQNGLYENLEEEFKNVKKHLSNW